MAVPYLSADGLLALDLVNKQFDAAVDYITAQNSNLLRYHTHACAEKAQSPLEVIFGTWWSAIQLSGDVPVGKWDLEAQVHVPCDARTYRLDFAVVPTWSHARLCESYGLTPPLVGVELDGHEFHEKTKAQVTYRNRRDRDLQAKGWKILHFSGSELVASACDCVHQAYSAADDAFEAAVYRQAELALERRA